MKTGTLITAMSLMALCGCAGTHSGAMGQAGPKAISETPGFDAKDPVIVSGIRERALSMIEQAAKSPDPAIRANAVEAASMAPDRLKKVIDAGLDDRNTGVRAVSAMAVGKARLRKSAARCRTLLV